ncbi:MAG: hypothetical protein JST91_07695 [Actinobacteria bacterium]|nr:hypothetical protein [Actinomycetota bacterium]
MDLFDVVRSCLRRWYVALPLLLIAAWFSYSAYTSAKPVYYSSAVVGLAPPSTRVDQTAPGAEVRRNGLLDIGGASLIANIAAWGLHDPAVVDRVVAAGGRSDYVARMFPVPTTMPQLPLIMIEATEATPEDATNTVNLVIAQAEPTLRTLQQQARVPDDQMVELFVVSPTSAPAEAMPSRTRSTIAIFLAGAGLSVLVTVLADVFLVRRRARIEKRHEEQAATAEAGSGPPGPEDGTHPADIDGHDGRAPAAEGLLGSR